MMKKILDWSIPVTLTGMALNFCYFHQNQVRYWLTGKAKKVIELSDEKWTYQLPDQFIEKIDKELEQLWDANQNAEKHVPRPDIELQGNFTKEGDFPSGRGVMTLKDKWVFIGEIRDGKLEGKGLKRSLKDTSVYRGEFKDGILHGYGVRSTPDETSSGYFVKGALQEGMVKYPTGQYCIVRPDPDNVMGGKIAKCYWPGGSLLYEGGFADTFQGKGVMVSEVGDVFIGNFENGRKQGYGAFYDKYGDLQYEGEFKRGRFQGKSRIGWEMFGHCTFMSFLLLSRIYPVLRTARMQRATRQRARNAQAGKNPSDKHPNDHNNKK